MIKISKTVTVSPEQWEIIIEGARNSYNSWDKSDSYSTYIENPETMNRVPFGFFMGDNDHTLMENLSNLGGSHSKFRRMIPVWVNISAPLYWWKEMYTYKVCTVSNSCSTMHKIAEKEFTIDDFSCEKLVDMHDEKLPCSERALFMCNGIGVMQETIDGLNGFRNNYLATNDKKYWENLIQLLPSSYNQKRTLMLNYETLSNIYIQRKNHKLDEWKEFCKWIETLPYSELITATYDKMKADEEHASAMAEIFQPVLQPLA